MTAMARGFIQDRTQSGRNDCSMNGVRVRRPICSLNLKYFVRSTVNDEVITTSMYSVKEGWRDKSNCGVIYVGCRGV